MKTQQDCKEQVIERDMHVVFRHEQQHLLGLALWTFCPHPSQQVGFPIAVHISASEKSKERCQGHEIKRRVRIVMSTSLSFHFPLSILDNTFYGSSCTGIWHKA